LPGLGSVLEKAGITALPKPKLAVFVGSAEGRDVSLKIDEGPRVNTVWGYLAWRLSLRCHASNSSRSPWDGARYLTRDKGFLLRE
jgi:hypothetical protein